MVKLYTIDCPKCKVLEKKLDAKGIIYEITKDKEEMAAKKMYDLPVLEVDNKILNFNEAVNWINTTK
jgi:hypothetical protein